MRAGPPPLPGGRFLADAAGASPSPPRRGTGLRWLVQKVLLGGVVAAGLVALIITAVLAGLLYRHSHPAVMKTDRSPAELFLRYEDVELASADGVSLAGWWIPGGEGLPILILAHDRGETRASLLGLAARLAQERYSILMIDLRGHGASQGTSSFGTLEKRDLLGAIDWAEGRTGADGSRIGLLGIGMGGYAAALAAAERPSVRALLLDTPYPEAASEFLAARLPSGVLQRGARAWSVFVYDLVYRVRSAEESLERKLPSLSDRDLLLIAPQPDPGKVARVRRLYHSVPESRHRFKNMLLLPATLTTPLYGDSRDRYDREAVSFFRSYLPPDPRRLAEPSGAGALKAIR